jgi:hypothetical protein
MQITPEDLPVFKPKQTSIPFEFTEFTLGEEKTIGHLSLEQELHSVQAS